VPRTAQIPQDAAGGDVAGATDVPARLGPFACFGQRWSICVDEPALSERLEHLYLPLLAPAMPDEVIVRYRVKTPADQGSGSVFRDGGDLGASRRPARVLGKLIWAINRQVIDNTIDPVLMHASAAADAAGRVVLLPAPMESGKTTLVTGLLDRGMHYLTDEASLVESDLTVRGFAKPLSIDRGSWDVLGHHEPQLLPELVPYMEDQWQVAPHTFTTVVPSGKLAVVVFPSYVTGSATSLDRLTPMDALDLARASTFGREGQPLPTYKIAQLAAMVTSVPCFALRSGELDEACAAVMGALEAADDGD
jgi:hypothetical protein